MITLLFSLGLAFHVAGQLTKAVCDSSFQWAVNSLNQSPCVVGSYLQATCANGSYTVYDLPDGFHYSGPKDPGSANECWCSSLTYSMLSACSLCQTRTDIISWTEWTTNCSESITSNGFWPGEIPVGTAVPAWGLETFQVNQTFSGLKAQETAATNTTELKKTATSSSPSISPSAPSGSTSPSSQSSGSGTNVAAIAGGVAGGVGGALLIAAIIFLIYRRRRNKTRHVAPSTLMQQSQNMYTSPTPASQNANRRLYDPSDPSTFPMTPPPISPGGNHQPISPTGTPSSAYHQFQPVRPASY